MGSDLQRDSRCVRRLNKDDWGTSTLKASILVHGGADTPLEGGARDGVVNAVNAGIKFPNSAMEMVQAAIRSLKDDGHYGAGAGSPLGVDGKVSLTANIMDGKTLNSGGVVLITGLKNPIFVARKVMETTDNRILAGEFATQFAHAFGFEDREGVNAARFREYKALKEQLKLSQQLDYLVKWPKLRELIRKNPKLFGLDTVGAVTIDRHGNMAAAGSSGGLTLQLPGRINDLAIIGAGIFADNKLGAVAVTGLGEFSIKYGVAREVCRLMKTGLSPRSAASKIIKIATKEDVPLGVIAMTRNGTWGLDWNSLPVMAHCHLTEGGQPEFDLKRRT